MAIHHGTVDPELSECLLEEPSMSARCPELARARAVTVTRAVDHDHAVTGRQAIHEAADREILDHGAVAVDGYLDTKGKAFSAQSVKNMIEG
jgi:hypothetical protein